MRLVPLADVTPRQLAGADPLRTRWCWSWGHRSEALHTMQHRFTVLGEDNVTVLHQHRNGAGAECNSDCIVVWPGLDPLPCERCGVAHQPTQACSMTKVPHPYQDGPTGVCAVCGCVESYELPPGNKYGADLHQEEVA